ncbi:RNA-binding protein RO60-like [Saccoglossus kowalevskii]|uniref:60 kDa SS-A/Ro ribonucleoprotein-like n=1 Tax=Saccoglossus kowalevskii TaxID=10224 RepID=A0ABM0MRE0_SACKO|nr:PREDICTED: 60 kDa SS-A/Ro ribonucleoprotein-like [Saccoglossus kowalevskii]
MAEKEDEERTVRQSERLMNDQVQDSAGGYVWKVDDFNRLRRFLCLGAEGGSYYVGEKELGKENAQCIDRLIDSGKGEEVVKEIVTFSVEGRTAKQNPVIFALAMCARSNDIKTKQAAYSALSDVCRIPTHLFMFVELAEKLSQLTRGTGWGRAQRRAIRKWYTEKDALKLALLVTKYKQRNGWSHRDLLRLAHIKPENDESMYALHLSTLEFVTTTLQIWKALLQEMPMTALLRNLGRMTSIGVLNEPSDLNLVIEKLSNDELLHKSRIHPFNVLLALRTYLLGRGDKGKLTWLPKPDIGNVLEQAFYKSFKNVEATGKRYLLAMDVSGSMSYGNVNGAKSITPAIASAAMLMVTAKTEKDCHILAFSDKLIPVNISADSNLNDVCQQLSQIQMGATDCAQPMLWARETKTPVDVFIIYTDSETWIGPVHPAQALLQYRKDMSLDSKLIVCAMASNGFTIADPMDAGMLDIAGFDSEAPNVMQNFALGYI